MTRTREAHERIKAEIVREKAAALGRAGERLEAALGSWRRSAGGSTRVSAPASGGASSATTRPRGGARFTRGWRS